MSDIAMTADNLAGRLRDLANGPIDARLAGLLREISDGVSALSALKPAAPSADQRIVAIARLLAKFDGFDYDRPDFGGMASEHHIYVMYEDRAREVLAALGTVGMKLRGAGHEEAEQENRE